MATTNAANGAGASVFAQAKRTRRKAKIGLLGPAGAGKTMTALRIARGLVGENGRIALLDTEHGSASLYADEVSFEVVELDNFAAQNYIGVINAAVAEGFDALVIDSLSHAWAGKGGILEFVDQKAKQSGSGSSFNAWRDATPVHNQLVEALVSAPIHLVVTMRTKMEHVQEKDERTNRTVIRKVGMQPVQRDGLEYEFDLIADLTLPDNDFVVSKTRYPDFTGFVTRQAGEEIGAKIRAFLDSGAAPAAQPQASGITVDQRKMLFAVAKEHGVGREAIRDFVKLLTGDPEGSTKSLDGVTFEKILAAFRAYEPEQVGAES